MKSFSSKIKIINGNSYVTPPKNVLAAIFKQAGKDTGAIPVRGTFNGVPFQQTLVRYAGDWRLYTNLVMLKAAGGLWVGDVGHFRIEFNPKPPTYPMPRKLALALSKSPKAKAAFLKLTPGRQKEIKRYLGFMKTDAAFRRNIKIVIQHLRGSRAPKTQYALMHRKRA